MGTKYESVGSTAMSLQLGVLSRGPRLYSTRRLVEEAQAQDIDVKVYDPIQFSIRVGGHGGAIYYDGAPLDVDAVIPRIGHTITRHGTAVLRALEERGVYAMNSSEGILRSRDKLRASQILARNRINVPTTVYVRDVLDVDQAIDAVGGLPVVVKVNSGTQGQGVFLRHTFHETRNLVQGLLTVGKAVLIQSYIAESHGRDIRALVVGDRVVASMRRRARGKEFRSNYHLNGTVERVVLPTDYALAARRAARVLGLKVCGVDLLEARDGPLVLEVNSSPGLEGIEKASGVNVAGEIIQFICDDQHFRDISLDNLMTTSKTRGMLTVSPRLHPHLIGAPISDVLDQVTVNITALARDMEIAWNPDPSTLIRFNDVLLLHGNLEELRAALSIVLRPSRTDVAPTRDSENAMG